MDIETAREYCLSKKAATEDTPFGEDFLVIRVMGKMFLCINLNTPDRITMKCDPDTRWNCVTAITPSKAPGTSIKSTGTKCSWTVTQMTS